MGSIWTVTPETVTYNLKYRDHDFSIELKKELTAGEAKKLEGAGFQRWRPATDAPDQLEMAISWDSVVFMKVLTWMVDWSLTEGEGKDRKKMDRSLDSLRALNVEVFNLIDKQVDEHIKALRKKEEPASETTPDSKPQRKTSA